jgi:hypothetical protein
MIRLVGIFKLIIWLLSKASSRIHIFRICRSYGYSKKQLTILFDALIMSFCTWKEVPGTDW